MPGAVLSASLLQTGTSLTETLGVLAVTGTGTSFIDFLGNAATLNFVSLVLEPTTALKIWNYSGTNDVLNITTGTTFGDLADVRFYSDSGSTLLGHGGFAGTQLVPVPEPSTWAMAIAGLAAYGWACRRRSAGRRRRTTTAPQASPAAARAAAAGSGTATAVHDRP